VRAQSQIEKLAKTNVDTHSMSDTPNCEKCSSDERTPIERIMSKAQLLPWSTEENFLVGDESSESNGVHVDAAGPNSPTTARQGFSLCRIRRRSNTSFLSRSGQSLNRIHGGATRCITLVWVMELDDFNGLEVLRRLLS
jgi:hypothetical protein